MINLILLVVAVVLFTIVAPIAFAYAIVTKIFRGLCHYYWLCALSFDQTGNAFCAPLFNDLMVKKGGHRFGNPDETISHVLGVNYVSGHLYAIGRGLSDILNFIDKNHVQKAAENEQFNEN